MTKRAAWFISRRIQGGLGIRGVPFGCLRGRG